MANFSYNVIMGVGKMYIGNYQAAEPADAAVNTTPQASAWTDVGFTSDGVNLVFNQSFAGMSVDQIADMVGRKMTDRDVQIATNLAEATLENLKFTLNSGAVSSGAGFKKYLPVFDGTELQPTYIALLFDGYAPASPAGVSKRRRFIGRRILSIENVEVPYRKGDMTLFPVTWGTHYIDGVTAPFAIVDET